MTKSPTILVVGGAGFIGSQVNKMLNQAGYQTIILDNLSRGHKEAVHSGIFIEGDIADPIILDKIFTHYSIDAVMHFAAFINVGESVADPAKYYLNNVSHTLNLLTAMIRHHVKTFIFSSTAAIFGNPNPEQPNIKEDDPCHPINPYGETKWMVEKILKDFDHAYGLKFCCLRYFNAAGGDSEGIIKNNQSEQSNLIPVVLRSLKNPAKQITIFGTDYPTPDGTCIRDYIHIEDLGRAHIIAMQKLLEGSPSDCYNLGNGKGFSVRQVIEATEKVLGVKVNTVEGPRRAGDPAILLADSSKALKVLGWSPLFSLDEMIQHAWNALSLPAAVAK